MSGERKSAGSDVGPSNGSGERRISGWMVLCLLLSTASGIGLLALYAVGGQTQLEGALLFVSLSGIGFSLILWGKYLFPPEIVTEPRGEHESPETERLEAERAFLEGEREIGRRSLLVRMLLGSLGALGLAAIFPIRSLGPSPGRSLFETEWIPGTRLVDENEVPIRIDDLGVGGVVTVFPEGAARRADSVAILVRVLPEQLALPEGRNHDAPEGNVCYSKLCTHAGCPVGLYLAESHQLQCPCHFSVFDVLNGAQPSFGPAARPLPQLPLEVDGEGFLVARGDFTAPVGPGFWNRGDGP